MPRPPKRNAPLELVSEERDKCLGTGLPHLEGQYVCYSSEDHPASLPYDCAADDANRSTMVPITVPIELMQPCADSFHQFSMDNQQSAYAVRALMFLLSAVLSNGKLRGTRLYYELLVKNEGCFPTQTSADNRQRLGPDPSNIVEAYGTSNVCGYRLWFYSPAGMRLDLHRSVLAEIYRHQKHAGLLTDEQYKVKMLSLKPDEEVRRRKLDQYVDTLYAKELAYALTLPGEEGAAMVRSVNLKVELKKLELHAMMTSKLQAPSNTQTNKFQESARCVDVRALHEHVVSVQDYFSMVLDPWYRYQRSQSVDPHLLPEDPTVFRRRHISMSKADMKRDLANDSTLDGSMLHSLDPIQWLMMAKPAQCCETQQQMATYQSHFPIPSLVWELGEQFVESPYSTLVRLMLLRFPSAFNPVELELAPLQGYVEKDRQYNAMLTAYKTSLDQAAGNDQQHHSLGTNQQDYHDDMDELLNRKRQFSSSVSRRKRVALPEPTAPLSRPDSNMSISDMVEHYRPVVGDQITRIGSIGDKHTLSVGAQHAANASAARQNWNVQLAGAVKGNQADKVYVESRIVRMRKQMLQLSARVQHVINMLPTDLMSPKDHEIPLELMDGDLTKWSAETREYYRLMTMSRVMRVLRQFAIEQMFAMLRVQAPDNTAVHMELSEMLNRPDGFKLVCPLFVNPCEMSLWAAQLALRRQFNHTVHGIVLHEFAERFTNVIRISSNRLSAAIMAHGIFFGPAGCGKSYTLRKLMEASLGSKEAVSYFSKLAAMTEQTDDYNVVLGDEIPSHIAGSGRQLSGEEKERYERDKEALTSHTISYVRNEENAEGKRSSRHVVKSNVVTRIYLANELKTDPTKDDPAMMTRFRKEVVYTTFSGPSGGLVSKLLQPTDRNLEAARTALNNCSRTEHAVAVMINSAIDLEGLPKVDVNLLMMMARCGLAVVQQYQPLDESSSRVLERMIGMGESLTISAAAMLVVSSELSPLLKFDRNYRLLGLQALDSQCFYRALAPMMVCNVERSLYSIWDWADEQFSRVGHQLLLLLASLEAGYRPQFYEQAYRSNRIPMPETLRVLCERSGDDLLLGEYTQLCAAQDLQLQCQQLIESRYTGGLSNQDRDALTTVSRQLQDHCRALEESLWERVPKPMFVEQSRQLYRLCAVRATEAHKLHPQVEKLGSIEPAASGFDTAPLNRVNTMSDLQQQQQPRTPRSNATYLPNFVRIPGSMGSIAQKGAAHLKCVLGIDIDPSQVETMLRLMSGQTASYPVMKACREQELHPGSLQFKNKPVQTNRCALFSMKGSGADQYALIPVHPLQVNRDYMTLDLMCSAETKNTRPVSLVLPISPHGFPTLMQPFHHLPRANHQLPINRLSHMNKHDKELLKNPVNDQIRKLLPSHSGMVVDDLDRLNEGLLKLANHDQTDQDLSQLYFERHLLNSHLIFANKSVGTEQERAQCQQTALKHPMRPGGPEELLQQMYGAENQRRRQQNQLCYPYDRMELSSQESLRSKAACNLKTFVKTTRQPSEWQRLNQSLVRVGVVRLDALPGASSERLKRFNQMLSLDLLKPIDLPPLPYSDRYNQERMDDLTHYQCNAHALALCIEELMSEEVAAHYQLPTERVALIYQCVEAFIEMQDAFRSVQADYARHFGPFPSLLTTEQLDRLRSDVGEYQEKLFLYQQTKEYQALRSTHDGATQPGDHSVDSLHYGESLDSALDAMETAALDQASASQAAAIGRVYQQMNRGASQSLSNTPPNFASFNNRGKPAAARAPARSAGLYTGQPQRHRDMDM